MVEKTQRFLVAVLRFHGDVLLTTPMINEIKENYFFEKKILNKSKGSLKLLNVGELNSPIDLS